MRHRPNHWSVLRAVSFGLVAAAFLTAAGAAKAAAEEMVLTCPIEGRDRVVSLSVTGNEAVYRYGRPGQAPELTLSSPLTELDYRRADGGGDTIDERVTFVSGDTRYELAAGFVDGAAADPTALTPFGSLTVSRGDAQLARHACRSGDIERVPDRLLVHMRDRGRERTSDGVSFPSYPVHPALSAAQSAACVADSNVDTCWSRGVSAARSGDLRGALEHYDMSCDARIGTMGCYEAGKLYLHNRQLRDYGRARQRLARTCDGDDSGQGPYACKYLGWMYLTGTGVRQNLDEAFGALAQACFLHNDQILIDPEGCHFLGQAALQRRSRSARDEAAADYMAYLSFAQGCTDNAQTVCEEARALYQRETRKQSGWISRCDRDAGHYGEVTSCADLAKLADDYDAAQATRRQLASLFRVVSTSMD